MILQVLAEAAGRDVDVRLRAAPGSPAARVLVLAGLADVLAAGTTESVAEPPRG
jgi:hypothetical protein